MKKILIVLWLAALFGSAFAQCPIKSATEKIVKPLICLDTLGRSATPDSAHITTYKDDASFATYFARSTTYPFTAASIDTTRPAIGGTAPVLYWLSETISNIDGTASNATLAINVQLWWKGYATDNMYCVQMVPDSLSDVIWRLALATAAPVATTSDSCKVSGTVLSGLNNVIKTNSFAAGAVDANAIATDAIGAAEIAAGAITSTEATSVATVNNVLNIASTDTLTTILGNVNGNVAGSVASVTAGVTLTAAGNASVADSVWGVAFTGGTSNVAAVTGSIGDSLNNTSYVGVVDWAKVNNPTTTVNLSGTTIGTLTTNSDKTGYSLTVAPLDSATTSRILGRKIWGVAAGTGSDSVAWASRTVSAAAGTGLDSATTSRIIKRTVWGIASGTGSDSTAIAERKSGTLVTALNLTTNNDKTGYTASTVSDKTGYSLSTAANASIADSVWGVAFTGGSSNVAAVTGSIGDSLNNSSYIGIVDWAKVNNPTTTVGLSGTTIGTLTTNSDKTGYSLTTPPLDSATTSRILGRKIWGVAAGTGADSVAWANRTASTAAGTGLDSATTSRIIKRTVWGVASGTGSDSTTKAQRVTGPNPSLDSINTFTAAPDLVDLIWDEDSTGHYTSPNMAFTSAQTGSSTGLDSATTSRIIRRTVWGMPLGTGSDSTAIAERKVGTVVTTNTATTATNLTTNNDKTGYALSTAGNASIADSVWGVAFTGGSSNVGAVTGSVGDSLNNSSYVGIVDWAKVNNPTSTVSLTNTTVATVTTTTTATNLTNAPTNGDLTATMKSSIGTQVWTTSTPRQLTGNFADTTAAKVWATGTKAITSVGSGAVTTSSFATGAIDAAAIATNALHFGTEIDTVGNEQGVKTEATTGGGGATAADIWSYGTRTLTSGAVSASIYPLMQITTTVDAAGTLTKYQFVIDTTAAGGSNEYALLNKAVTLRDTSTSWGKPYFNGIIERANCVAGSCTLQVSDSCAFPIAAGDSLWIWNGGPQYVMATLSEAAATQADTLLGRDSTGQSAGTIGQAIVEGGTGGGGSDTTDTKTMLQNMGLQTALDSIAEITETTTREGMLRRGEVPTLAESADSNANRMQSPGVNVTSIRGDTTLVIDTARNAGLLALTDENIDSIAAKIIAGGGSQLGSGTAQACTLFVMNGATPVPDAYIRILNTAETQQYAAWYSDVNGRRIFNLDDGSYKVRVRLLGYNQTTNPQTVVVSSGANDTIQLSVYDPDPRKAIFAMNLSSLDSSFRFAKADFTLMNLVKDDILIDTSGSAIAIGLPQVVKTRAVGDGVLTVALYKNSNMRWYKTPNTASNKTYWRVRIAKEGKDVSNPDLQFNIAIPSDSTYYRVTGGF